MHDVDMLDVSDQETIKHITGDVLRQRQAVHSRGYDAQFDKYRQTLPTDIRGLFLVDTNFVISHLSMVRALVEGFGNSQMLVLIPWIVIQELDGLKNAPNEYGQANLASLVRSAIKYIHGCLSSSTVGLRGQKLNESLESGQTGDDAILDCARYWKEVQELPTVLLSNDINLCSKALIHDVPTVTFELGLTADKILDQVVKRWDHTQQTRMEVDERPKETLAPTVTPDVQVEVPPRSEMETDAIVAGFYDPKRWQDDPFETLARKAGESPYAAKARSVSSPDTSIRGRRRGSSSRRSVSSSRPSLMSLSPVSDRRDSPKLTEFNDGLGSYRGVADTQREATQDVLRDVVGELESTLTEALPPLVRAHLQKELDDADSVEFLMKGCTSVADVTQLLINNWFMCFGRLLNEGASHEKEDLKAVFIALNKANKSNKLHASQVKELIEKWSSIWRLLSRGVRGTKYSSRRDEHIQRWLALL